MSGQKHSTRQLMKLGIAQAVLFMVGAMLGRGLGLLLGLDAFGSGEYNKRELIGIALIGLGGGAGAQAARVWYVHKYGDPRG
ncbi:hypothetical protein EJP67_20615 [Variovorax guangxiensis]|jgi:mannitol-specific phosphotransferase system IIBC component|uniref:Uncharacterized protein n=1 Tax=Variovorax guangxiensis TaxID=1775474 RepID=A0A3S0XTZ3_9BURK|nr:hypothetical protein [Variovorax guangxiensis]RUR69462.1 hypothetical protein EJP67_20615 [Variovorax guangxiensis]